MAYQDIVQELYDVRAKPDLDRLMGCLHPEGAFHIVGTEKLGALTQRQQGAASIRTAAGQLLDDWDMSRVENVSIHESA